MRADRGEWLAAGAETLLLAVVLAFISLSLVHSHWTSIWMDREFTGWAAPIANRLAAGAKLYGPEAHMPMPPLPFLVAYGVAPGRATWLTESALIVACQSALVLALYFGFSGRLPRPIPILASLLSIPVYFALPKTILYDATTQLLVAVTAIVGVIAIRRFSREPESEGHWRAGTRRVIVLAPAAFLTAATLFSKQSTGMGMVLGIAIPLCLAGTGRRLASRLFDAVVFVAISGAFLIGLAVACRDFLSVPGMIRDVFLTGSEPKGGLAALFQHTLRFSRYTIENMIMFIVYGVTFWVFFAGMRRRGADLPVPEPDSRPRMFGPSALACAVVLAAPLVLGIFEVPAARRFIKVAQLLVAVRLAVLWSGLVFALALYVRERYRGQCEAGAAGWLASFAPVLYFPAFFHSMSVQDFRWTYDNNPMITLALAGFLYVLFRALPPANGRPGIRARAPYLAALFLISCAMWGGFARQYAAARACTQEWTEVRHLRGAKLRKSAEGMRQLVAAVRKAAPNVDSDEVLLLPNDPNVEAWFERRRPKLAGAIVFTDQYWDRYVDGDFRRLTEDPPKVIVIGPRNYWSTFGDVAWGKGNRGFRRLADLVQTRLLPSRYVLKTSQRIHHGEYEDFMDVYVRNDGAPLASKSAANEPLRR